mmetsp:Transcript_88382/g.245344  ORF Transcript_88382/g.245344 Transcript_88382/m.245344 type:complete len:247 (+) Transcript_88382:883-1623(+)
MLAGTRAPRMLRAVAAEDEKQVVTWLCAAQKPLQSLEYVCLGGRALGLGRPAVSAVEENLELVFAVLQRVAEQALEVPHVVDATLQRSVRGSVVDADKQRAPAPRAARERPLRDNEARHSTGGRRLAAVLTTRQCGLALPKRLLATLHLRVRGSNALTQVLHSFLVPALEPAEPLLPVPPCVLGPLLPGVNLLLVARHLCRHLNLVHLKCPLLHRSIVKTLHLLLHVLVLCLEELDSLLGVVEPKR